MNVKHLTSLLVLFVLTITACTEDGSQPSSGGNSPAATANDAARVVEVMEAFVAAYTSGGDVSPYAMGGTFDDHTLKFYTTMQYETLLSAWVEPDSVEIRDQGRDADIYTVWDCEHATIRIPFNLKPDADGEWKIVKSSSVTEVIEEK
jgi:hypothetical protein